MGRFDSSKTRVAPVFEHLLESDPTGASWLRRLIELGSRSDAVSLPPDIGELKPDHPSWWGANERPLHPPLNLLEWLVQNISMEAVDAANDRPEVRTKREALGQGDPETVEEALRRLRAGERGRKWFVLEGPSYPDAFLETESIVLVVEGKRTERSTTTKTKWMGKRSQLTRHMDGALEIAGDRRVLGLLLVEGEEPDPMAVPEQWARASSEQLGDLLDPSLPHRTKEARERIAAGILGAATWQSVCSEFSIPWPPADEIEVPSDDPNEAERVRLEDERRSRLEIVGPKGDPDDSFDVDGEEEDEDESE